MPGRATDSSGCRRSRGRRTRRSSASRSAFKDGLPQAMRLADNFGQVTQLTFAKVERNPKLDGAAFAFTPPKGADVLTDRR